MLLRQRQILTPSVCLETEELSAPHSLLAQVTPRHLLGGEAPRSS